jgi:DnaK suppressor protein
MNIPANILADIKKQLEEEKNKIKTTSAALKLQDPFSDPDRLIDNAASDTDAKEESSHERMEAIGKELDLHMVEIEEALQKIQNGTYGKCLSCKKNIDSGRLAIKPTALYCVTCEIKKEK